MISQDILIKKCKNRLLSKCVEDGRTNSSILILITNTQKNKKLK